MRFFWILPLLGTIAAFLTILMTLAGSRGAQQEAAGFALACALAIVPYVFVRALAALTAPKMSDEVDRVIKAMMKLKND